VSLSTVQAIEAGRSARVRFGTMERLADVLGVEPEEIDDFAPSFWPRRHATRDAAGGAGGGDQTGAAEGSAGSR
jgi:hypothetical protein